MALCLNRATLIGRLGADPEVRYTQDQKMIVSLRVATTESWKDKNGEWKERVEWHRIVIFNEHLAKFAQQNLRKGSRVFLEGRMQRRTWQDQAGVERHFTEIVLQQFSGVLMLLESSQGKEHRDRLGGSGSYDSNNNVDEGRDVGVAFPDGMLDDDEIPF